MPVASVYPRLKVPQRAEALGECEAMRGWNIDDTPTTRGTSDTCGGVALPVKVQDERTRVQHEAARTRVTERERERERAKALREQRAAFYPLTYPASCCATATGFGLVRTGTGTRGK